MQLVHSTLEGKMTPEYLAGLFDGEGCIDVQRMYPKANERLYVRPRIRMCMAASTLPLGEKLHERFGGHLMHRKAGAGNQQASWSLEWLSKSDILKFLDTVEPYLILKAEQAKLARWWLVNASGRQTKSGYAGMEKARAAFADELSAMKRDPQRLSERAVELIASLMRQSDLRGDTETLGETTKALVA